MLGLSYCRNLNLKSICQIDDIGENTNSRFLREEIDARCLLASLYQLADLYGWSQTFDTCITLRVENSDEILIIPFGLLFCEATASALVKVDFSGTIIDPGTTNLGVNKAGVVLHSSIHACRPDAKCIIHLRTPSAVAVSSIPPYSLLPISREALIVGRISFHDPGNALPGEDRAAIATDIGVINKVIALRSSGIICVGETVEEAFHLAFHTMRACKIQTCCATICPNLLKLRPDASGGTLVDPSQADSTSFNIPTFTSSDLSLPPPYAALEYEAHMRMMDRMGFSTGYTYRNRSLHHFYSLQRVMFDNQYNDEQVFMYLPEQSIKDSVSLDNLMMRRSSVGYDSSSPNNPKTSTFSASDSVMEGGEPLSSHQYLESTSHCDAPRLSQTSGFSEVSVPNSESSKELFIRLGYTFKPEVVGTTTAETPTPPPADSPTQSSTDNSTRKHHKNYSRHSAPRRSRSLTSGVEKAIFRRITEKYRSEIR